MKRNKIIVQGNPKLKKKFKNTISKANTFFVIVSFIFLFLLLETEQDMFFIFFLISMTFSLLMMYSGWFWK